MNWSASHSYRRSPARLEPPRAGKPAYSTRFVDAALQNGIAALFVRRTMKRVSAMSRQLSVVSAFSILALSALALFAPGSARLGELVIGTGAAIEIAAPAFSAELPLID
jgi:hypothetical protein